MANTFGILSALVLAFTAFVVFKNKEEFEKQVKNTEIEQGKFDVNTKTFNGLVDDNKQLVADALAANKSRDEFQAKLDAQDAENEKLQMMITKAERELETVKAEVADAKATLQELGPLEALAGKIEDLNSEIADLEDEVATLKTNIDRLEGDKASTAKTLAFAKDKLANITAGRSQPAMSAKVNRIDRRLGFVMLSKGIKGGVVGGSRVAVMRDGKKIGELSVTAVSANSATADIVHSTITEGEDVSVGDTVVPIEGLKIEDAAASADAPVETQG
ncbi:MAG: hypothetical protein ACON4R_13785 [Akkermansiaceae bacterium]